MAERIWQEVRKDEYDIMDKEINTLDRDALYNLICKVHATFQEAANECHAAYDGSQDYYAGKAVAYEDVVYTIEQEMKKLYDAQRYI